MTAQKGRDLLIEVRDDTGVLHPVAGIRTTRMSFSANAVDVTDRDSPGQWRELLSGAGTRRASLAGSGIFRDAASDALVRNAFFAGTALDCDLKIPAFGTLSAAFAITALAYQASHDGEIAFDIALESAGPITFLPAP